MKNRLHNHFQDFQKLNRSNKISVIIAALVILFFSILASSSIFLQKELRTNQDIRKEASVSTAAKLTVKPGHKAQLLAGQTHTLSLYLTKVRSSLTDFKLTFYISTDKPGVVSNLILKQPSGSFLTITNDNLTQLNPTTYQVRFLGLNESQAESQLGEIHLADIQLNVNQTGAIKIEFDPSSFIYTADDRNELVFDTPIILAAIGSGGTSGATTKGGVSKAKGSQTINPNEPPQPTLTSETIKPTTPPQPTEPPVTVTSKPTYTPIPDQPSLLDLSPTTAPTKPLSEQTAWDAILAYLEEKSIGLPMVAAGGLAVLILLIGFIAIINQLKGSDKEPNLDDFKNLSKNNFNQPSTEQAKKAAESQTQGIDINSSQTNQPEATNMQSDANKLIDVPQQQSPSPSSMVNRLKEKGITQPPTPPTPPEE